MIRAVLDANVYVSAAIQPNGTPGRILETFLREQRFVIVLSPAILLEVERALRYPRVRRYLKGEFSPELWLEDIVFLADLVEDRVPPAVCRDPQDNKYIAAALEGRAGYLVSGDQALLSVRDYQGVQIVTPLAFLKALLSR